MSSLPVPPLSPGVGARRKHIPKLPLSAFSTGTSSGFPVPPSPSTIHPSTVIDSRVSTSANISSDLAKWKFSSDGALGNKLEGVIVSLSHDVGSEESIQEAIQGLSNADVPIPIIAVSVPFPLSAGVPSSDPTYLSDSKFSIALSSQVTSESSEAFIAGVKWALSKGHVVELDVIGATGDGNQGWEGLEEIVQKAQEGIEHSKAIVISNILPPPISLDLPIVKVLTHPGYIAYQSHIASLSLVSNTFLKFIPPAWNANTPRMQEPQGSDPESGETEEAGPYNAASREWKRRIKMYLGHAVEAFGSSRIIFGSSPLKVGPASKSSDWYNLARESLAELGVEQEDVNAVFVENAKAVYKH